MLWFVLSPQVVERNAFQNLQNFPKNWLFFSQQNNFRISLELPCHEFSYMNCVGIVFDNAIPSKLYPSEIIHRDHRLHFTGFVEGIINVHPGSKFERHITLKNTYMPMAFISQSIAIL